MSKRVKNLYIGRKFSQSHLYRNTQAGQNAPWNNEMPRRKSARNDTFVQEKAE